MSGLDLDAIRAGAATDIPALLAEVERLRAQLDAVKKIVRSPGITTVKGSPADKILRIIEGGDHQ